MLRRRVAVAVVALAAGVAGCGSAEREEAEISPETPLGTDTTPATTQQGPQQEQTPRVTTAEVLGDPDRYLGRTVSIRAQVDRELIAPQLFTIGRPAGNRSLAVVATPDTELPPDTVTDGDLVEVTGRVTRLDLDAMADRLVAGRSALEPFAGRPVLVAQSIRLPLRENRG